MKKAVLFDVDGTLLDTYNFVFDAVSHTISLHGQVEPSAKQIKEAMGKPIHEFYKILVPSFNPVPFVNSHKQFQLENMHLVKLFPKTKEILKMLKQEGFLIGAVSNRRKKSLLDSLKMMGILHNFDVIVSAEDVRNPKPHKDHVLTALKRLKIKPDDAVMVGDTYEDIMAGKNAGVKIIAATYGFLGSDIKKHDPDYVIDDLGQLSKIIKIC